MTTLEPAPVPSPTRELRRLRLLAWSNPLAVVVTAGAWNVGAALLDASPLGNEDGLFGFGFAAAIYTALVGVPLFVLVTLAALLAQFVGPAVRAGLVTGVVLSAIAGFALGVLGLVALTTGDPGGDTAYGVLTVLSGLVLLAPGWLAWDDLVRS